MSFKVQVGPPQIAIHQGMTVLVTEPDGQVTWPSDKGLYFLDTRLISAWSVYANGASWELLNGGAISHDTARMFLTNCAFLTEDGPIAGRTLGFILSRRMAGGLREDLDIANHGSKPVRFNLEIAIRSDFADIFDVKSKRDVRRGRIDTAWSEVWQILRTTYRNQDFHRAIAITVADASSQAVLANGRLSFEIALQPGAHWHASLLYDFSSADRVDRAPRAGDQTPAELAWAASAAEMQTSNETFRRFYRQAVNDIASLRLPLLSQGKIVHVPAAGLPWFMAPFGRDSLIVSLQTIMIDPDFARGALAVLGDWQATAHDDYRDAEPGKIMHELRYGELAHFKLIPHTP